jgi:hypothetical protein
VAAQAPAVGSGQQHGGQLAAERPVPLQCVLALTSCVGPVKPGSLCWLY